MTKSLLRLPCCWTKSVRIINLRDYFHIVWRYLFLHISTLSGGDEHYTWCVKKQVVYLLIHPTTDRLKTPHTNGYKKFCWVPQTSPPADINLLGLLHVSAHRDPPDVHTFPWHYIRYSIQYCCCFVNQMAKKTKTKQMQWL